MASVYALSILSIPAWFDWRPMCRMVLSPVLPAFNPSLVRLALRGTLDGLGYNYFQSQLGSIGASRWPGCRRSSTCFQSQLGSIGALPVGGIVLLFDLAFNPSLVRLALVCRSVSILRLVSFNPSLVRLAHGSPALTVAAP